MKQLREVSGIITIPFSFSVVADSDEAALNYAIETFDIIRMEASMECRKGKEHLLIADELKFEWNK